MKLVENKYVKGLIDDLHRNMEQTAKDILILKELVEDGETDDLDVMRVWDNNVYEINAAMFAQKMALMKVQKAAHKHVAHILNPIPKTAPKKSEMVQPARKGKDLSSGKVDTPSNKVTIKRNKNDI